MGVQIGGIDHQAVIGIAGGGKGGKYLVEDAQTAPADKPVVDRLVRSVSRRCIAPPLAIANDKDDPAQHPSAINPRHTMRQPSQRSQIVFP